MSRVVVFPVPRHMTPDEAFAELEALGHFHGYRWWKPRFWRPRWAVRHVEEE